MIEGKVIILFNRLISLININRNFVLNRLISIAEGLEQSKVS